jgi:hypothetical protein
MTPVELEAIEQKGLLATIPQRARSWKSHNENSSSSRTVHDDLVVADSGEKVHDNHSEEIPITLMTSSTRMSMGAFMPRSPEAVEFLDLNSTESEGSQDEDMEVAFEDAAVGLSAVATPLGSPLGEEAGVDPILTAAIISAAVESFESSSAAAKSQQVKGVDHAEEVEKEVPRIHEMDVPDPTIKRQSKRQSSHPTQKKRPDFISFKKQMTEAERRAKMISKRRRSRRRLTPKSF